ncbi:3'-5' exonuclease [Haladaptatus sp. DJG-WS-42]|uniref:3'-5' exonuclease n=1 Tax=Haladaptatus sp. DJG-WS-42 TaxID=3120516 RepID=UPI0030D2E17A
MIGSEPPVVTIDIETTSPTLDSGERPNFQNPRDFEIFTINVGAIESDGSQSTAVFLREDSSPESELAVIESAVEWCHEKDPDVVYSYNGESFDFIHLAGRPALAAQEAHVEDTVSPLVTQFLQGTQSIDLKKPIWTKFGAALSFEDAVSRATGQPVARTVWQEFDHGIPLAKERAEAGLNPSPPDLQPSDIPILGEYYLTYCDAGKTATTAFTELERMLTRYGNNDVAAQFELAHAVA